MTREQHHLEAALDALRDARNAIRTARAEHERTCAAHSAGADCTVCEDYADALEHVYSALARLPA